MKTITVVIISLWLVGCAHQERNPSSLSKPVTAQEIQIEKFNEGISVLSRMKRRGEQ